MREIDVRHLGRERVICCWEVDGVLVDPGPESSLDTLLAALGDEPPKALLLTHIHLDHAGAAGAIVRRWPEVPVYVHEVGAPHLADPSNLLESVSRLYGDEMERLWGDVVPVPEGNLRPLAGGEEVEGFRVADTPGHASHHVCYLHLDSGRAFVGDIAGVRIVPDSPVLPPTLPPEFDLEAWNDSLSTVAEWRPESLGLTHFGIVDAPYEHLAAMRDALTHWSTLGRELDRPAFEAQVVKEVEAGSPNGGVVAAYVQACPPPLVYSGLERYWSNREGILGP